MNADLQKLININKLEKQIEALDLRIEAHYKDIRKKEDEIIGIKKKQVVLEENIIQIENLIIKSNEDIKVQNIELYNLKLKIKESKSDKEIKNLSMDEDVIEEKIVHLKREIENSEKRKIRYKNDIKDLDELRGKILSDIETMKQEADEGVKELKSEQQEIYNKHSDNILMVSQSILSFYEKIKKWAGTTSIVEVRKGACGGCFIRLNNRMYLEVKNEEHISNCPHCGRILYISQ